MATVDDIIAKIRELPNELTLAAAPEAAEAVFEVLSITIKAGQSPDGKAWAPRKVGTGPVLENALSAVRCFASGPVIYITVKGINARHHRGNVKGKVRRQIIPSRKLTPEIIEAIRNVIYRRFDDTMNGGTSG